MRLAFFLLLLGNLAFYVWGAGYLGGTRIGHEPERLAQQLQPEKVRIVVQDHSKHDKATSSIAEEVIVCRRISGFQGLDGVALDGALAVLAATAGISIVPDSRQLQPAATAFWVLIPGLANRQFADKKLLELRQLGVNDAKIADDDVSGPLMVLLGVFATEKEAQDHLGLLARRGVRSARMMLRQHPEQLLSLDVRAQPDVLKRLPAALDAYPGFVFGECTSSNTGSTMAK